MPKFYAPIPDNNEQIDIDNSIQLLKDLKTQEELEQMEALENKEKQDQIFERSVLNNLGLNLEKKMWRNKKSGKYCQVWLIRYSRGYKREPTNT